MKNKMEIKWTDEELKQLDDVCFDSVKKSYAEHCEAVAEYLMSQSPGRTDFGKLPKYIHRHGGKYAIQKLIDGTNYTFGSYDTLEEATSMANWILSHEHPEKISSKVLKLGKKKYVSYLYKLKEKEEKQRGDTTVSTTPKKNSKKILKSLTLPRSSEKVLKNLRQTHEIKQNEVVQVALDLLDEMSYEDVEKILVNRGIH